MQQEPHGRQILQSAPPPPKGLHSRVPVAGAAQEASQLGDPARRLAQGRRRERERGALVDVDIEGVPFIRL